MTEILGAGDPSRPFQKFHLKQAPVTQRLAATETGVASTLSVRVDGVAWTEVPDLYQRGATARVFRATLTDSGATVIEFGDGVSGARPTPGRDNIVADYSRGLGLAGNLRPGQLNLPLDRPLGLREAFNPLAATGGDDPEAAADARRNAAALHAHPRPRRLAHRLPRLRARLPRGRQGRGALGLAGRDPPHRRHRRRPRRRRRASRLHHLRRACSRRSAASATRWSGSTC